MAVHYLCSGPVACEPGWLTGTHMHKIHLAFLSLHPCSPNSTSSSPHRPPIFHRHGKTRASEWPGSVNEAKRRSEIHEKNEKNKGHAASYANCIIYLRTVPRHFQCWCVLDNVLKSIRYCLVWHSALISVGPLYAHTKCQSPRWLHQRLRYRCVSLFWSVLFLFVFVTVPLSSLH